jgi:hypothetical protein
MSDNFFRFYRSMFEAKLAARLTGSEGRALDLIIVEYLKHAGKDNGRLVVTQADFIKTGRIDKDSIAHALRGLVAKGFIAMRGGEYNPSTGRKNCHAFALAFLDNEGTYRKPSVLCRPGKPDKEGGKSRITGTAGKPDNRGSAENPDNYLEEDLPLPSDAAGQASAPDAPPSQGGTNLRRANGLSLSPKQGQLEQAPLPAVISTDRHTAQPAFDLVDGSFRIGARRIETRTPAGAVLSMSASQLAHHLAASHPRLAHGASADGFSLLSLPSLLPSPPFST